MDQEPTEHTPHIVPLKTYLMVGGALLILTILTVTISTIPLGGWNVVVALTIASLKALLVAMFFMHLYYDKKIFLIIFSSAIIMLGIFITLTMFDTLERGRVNPVEERPYQEKATIYQQKATPPSGVDSTAAPTEKNP